MAGTRSVSILEHRRHNRYDPTKENGGFYNNEELAPMRRVVAYCSRYVAQEQRAMGDPNSKSYRSLKNWGHDSLKK